MNIERRLAYEKGRSKGRDIINCRLDGRLCSFNSFLTRA